MTGKDRCAKVKKSFERDFKRETKFTVSGDDGEGVPPVPIPNTEVKTFSADGTWLDTARESRTLPESI